MTDGGVETQLQIDERWLDLYAAGTCATCERPVFRRSLSGQAPKYCSLCRKSARRRARDKWKEANPDAHREAQRKYELAHKDEQDERRRQWGIRNFEARRIRIKQWREENRDRVNESARASRARSRAQDPEKAYLQKKAQHLRQLYGMEIGDYDALLARQGGGCAVCGITTDKVYGLHVDHNHDTGKVRGLLCGNCNIMIGMARENTFVLFGAIEYLESHEGD